MSVLKKVGFGISGLIITILLHMSVKYGVLPELQIFKKSGSLLIFLIPLLFHLDSWFKEKIIGTKIRKQKSPKTFYTTYYLLGLIYFAVFTLGIYLTFVK